MTVAFARTRDVASSHTRTHSLSHTYTGAPSSGLEYQYQGTRQRVPLKEVNLDMSQSRGRKGAKGADGVNGGANGWLAGAAPGAAKRKAAEYDEDVEGFQFSRATQSKKPKPTAVAHEPSPRKRATEDNITQQLPAPKPKGRGRPPKNAQGPPEDTPNGKHASRPQRRTSKRLMEEDSTQTTELPSRSRRKLDEPEPPPLHIPKKRSGRRKESIDPVPQEDDEEAPGAGTQKIALPFADTPVIKRNKEMRMEKSKKGNRRSSLGMRGRRASWLIESGTSNALPHDEVNTADFYKHIESEGLSEPKRMRQLLTWCATRAMGEKPSGSRSEDESARLAARVIQEEILKELGERSELSDWFSREESTPPPVVVKKPNPRNIQNAEKIKELEEHIRRLQDERQSLASLLRPPSIPRMKPPAEKPHHKSSATSSSPETQQSSSDRSADSAAIDPSLLDPSQQNILSTLSALSPSISISTSDQTQSQNNLSVPAISSRLSRITSTLAPTLDAFASGINNIELFRDAADRVAGRVLSACAQRLEERDLLIRRKGRSKETDDEGNGEGADAERNEEEGEGTGTGFEKEDLAPVLGALSRVERRMT